MNVTEAIKKLEESKASELFFSDIIDYVTSIQNGDNEVFDLATLDLIQSNINATLEFLSIKKQESYDAVINIGKMEIQDGDKSKRGKGSSAKRAVGKTKS